VENRRKQTINEKKIKGIKKVKKSKNRRID